MNDNTNTTSELPIGQILVGDARQRIHELPRDSIDCVITSPPYFRLRNYQTGGQIGLEDHVEGWVSELLLVFDGLQRVLKPSGSVWLNLGDSYSRHARHGAPKKSLLLGPERLLLALARRGWLTRNKVIWAKTNPQPASARDRLSPTWEPLFLLTRSPTYFFDLDAIRIPPRVRARRSSHTSSSAKYATSGGRPGAWAGPLAGTNAGLQHLQARGRTAHPLGKNPGDVWAMPTASYRGAHFATFPERLVRRPLLASCPAQVCATCGTPWWPSPRPQVIDGVNVRGPYRKSCPCPDRAWQPGVVLDPFMGSGTVAVVAEAHQRRWIGCELNADFAVLARRRLQAERVKRGSQ
jgi:site-specific DNA-methyltransferase (adenine-specific)